ncbi:MAG: hypothetical protein R2941_10105 [Desulfobacterales bacterium]
MRQNHQSGLGIMDQTINEDNTPTTTNNLAFTTWRQGLERYGGESLV